MMPPHPAHFMAADALHAERLATAARHRLVASQLKPHAGTPHVRLNRGRVAAALTSLVLAIVVATGVSAAVGGDGAAPAGPDAAGAGQAPGGGATYIR